MTYLTGPVQILSIINHHMSQVTKVLSFDSKTR